MNLALLHDTAWPDMGGVENVIRDQAFMLANAGHNVKVIAGRGHDPGDGYEFVLLPQIAPDFPLNKTVRAVLDRGQADQNFSQYRSMLVDALSKVLAGVDVTLVHNLFTTHQNLALTRALHDLAPRHRLVAWTHDLTAAQADVSLSNPTKPPWSLVRTGNRDVTYIAVSNQRAAESKIHLKLPVSPKVIPDMADPARIFGCTPEVRKALLALEIPWRDFVFLLPSRPTARKNLEFAIEVVRILREMDRNPLLLITGAALPDSPASQHYGAFLRQSLPAGLDHHVIFLSDYFEVRDETLRDLYLLSDCLLFPSKQEGFGLPVLEAAMLRLPVWCGDIPAFRALEGSGSFLFDKIEKLPQALHWLEEQSAFRQQRRCRRLFDPIVVYNKYYDPFLKSLVPDKS
jgi:glycosyltransferase involved in cell wall biosynthesis